MPLPRVLAAEMLDFLPPDDPRARRSRRDLRRVNALMGSSGILLRGIRSLYGQQGLLAQQPPPLRVLELGAGDGSLMLRMARHLSRLWPTARLQLLDRLTLIDEATCRAFAHLGWVAQPWVIDVLEWAGGGAIRREAGYWDLIITNLFLHHFEPPQLRALLAAVAARCDCFVACEPRRAPMALLGSHLLGFIGVNAVTRNDAVLSVRAGFRDAELSALWPAPAPPDASPLPQGGAGWVLQERPAGLFSHFFGASRCVIGERR